MAQLANRGPNVVGRVIFVLNFVIEELRTSVFDYSALWAVKKRTRRLCSLQPKEHAQRIFSCRA